MDRQRLTDVHATLAFGRAFAERLIDGDVVALSGELGAGKTTLVQGILEGLGVQDMAQSPTFTYLHSYDARVHHFDLYRLRTQNDFIALGFEEFLQPQGVTLIEWPERIEALLPKNCWRITLTHDDGRTVQVQRC